ncbi:cell division suppressor protein YneA [Ammoniphilus resinae]|uniref:LysM repeat protein n=1 Tax=Ammoniphilus resinae TaxID=861532 RepID=A0ABS4GTR4_9BACL|nr:LysM peptidoglycan-binding domain-containing protein [Ammoniphilus resinae]MBP1933676.1 LysM repeat protein [Ammoniphilus resinae]
MKQYLFIIMLGSLLFTSVVHIVSGLEWSNTAEASSFDYIEVPVEMGDTLWTIADRYNEEHQRSIRDMVRLIIDENNLQDPYIYPGQNLHIPNP